MPSLQSILRRAARDLDALGFRWALVGGLAVSARCAPRFTADVDLAVAVSDDTEAEVLARELGARGWRLDTLVEQERTKRLATLRVTSEETHAPVVDLLFASSGLELDVVAAAEVLEVFPGQSIPVASLGHLIALKLLARGPDRPLDDADLLALVATATREDLAVAREAVGLIQRRGYARGRDLDAALSNLVGS